MIITTDAVLAMRCPECGKMGVHNFSRFAFPAGKTVPINCSCGAPKVEVTKSGSVYLLEINCMFCEDGHLHRIAAKALWSGEIARIVCDDTDLIAGNIGPASQVDEMLVELEQYPELENTFSELNCDNYFNNARIALAVLNRLRDIAAADGLYCQCGNHKIEVNIFPDRVELYCNNCDSINIVYAETDEDLHVIQQVELIEMARHGFECLDSLANAGKLNKTRRHRNET